MYPPPHLMLPRREAWRCSENYRPADSRTAPCCIPRIPRPATAPSTLRSIFRTALYGIVDTTHGDPVAEPTFVKWEARLTSSSPEDKHRLVNKVKLLGPGTPPTSDDSTS